MDYISVISFLDDKNNEYIFKKYLSENYYTIYRYKFLEKLSIQTINLKTNYSTSYIYQILNSIKMFVLGIIITQKAL